MPKILLALVITVLDEGYYKVACWLNNKGKPSFIFDQYYSLMVLHFKCTVNLTKRFTSGKKKRQFSFLSFKKKVKKSTECGESFTFGWIKPCPAHAIALKKLPLISSGDFKISDVGRGSVGWLIISKKLKVSLRKKSAYHLRCPHWTLSIVYNCRWYINRFFFTPINFR